MIEEASAGVMPRTQGHYTGKQGYLSQITSSTSVEPDGSNASQVRKYAEKVQDPQLPDGKVKRDAHWYLAAYLDKEGAIRDALAVRRSLVENVSARPEGRAQALLQGLADAVLLHADKEGVTLVNDNLVWLPTQKERATALVFESMFYADEGRVADSDRALKGSGSKSISLPSARRPAS